MINLPQRIGNLTNLFNQALREYDANMHVSLPCIVTGFDPEKQTISCIPAVRELVNLNGTLEFVDFPELKDVPIEVPRAGGFSITLPITVGQECRVTFQDLCIDGWWARGGIQNWNDLRRHDLSDAIATFSPWSQGNTLSNYSTDSLEIRKDDGSISIKVGSDTVEIKNGDYTKVEIKNQEIGLQMGETSLKIKSTGIEMVCTSLLINGQEYKLHQHFDLTEESVFTGKVYEV